MGRFVKLFYSELRKSQFFFYLTYREAKGGHFAIIGS
jgi:hypothetical protein